MRRLMVNIYISRCLFLIIAVCNFALPLYNTKQFNTFILQFVIEAVWLYGLLSQAGYFKTPVSDDLDDTIHYEFNIPFLAIGLLRIVETGYFYLVKRDVMNWKMFLVLVIMDVVYTAFLLMDKSRYYFESEDN